ncbi:MAG: capsular biosynthesis protein [Thiohalocapsa sp.]|jgi:capsular polysaccharide export protein|uniref:capsular polysaccharide export protein, LipB/KpsS family n=1 Tax=Thiohalocapsa sp. TaxID=2497641 RepID=UPI0025FD2B81|nr:capsular biosynthesis protein [Thiohalocapsa sp.]MCG6942428.1 capsular biosynthesis protein [Thiohalocapsa sp.]
MPRRTIAFIDPGMRLAPFLCAASAELPATIQSAFYARRPKPRSILRNCGHAPAPERIGALRRRRGAAGSYWHAPDIDPDALMAGLRLPRHREAVATASPEYRAVERSVRDFLDHRAPDGLFCWNGSGLAAGIAAQIAGYHGIPVAYGENGYLPGTMQLDPMGVNAAASFGPAHTRLEQILALQWTDSERDTLRQLLDGYRRGERVAPRVPRPRELSASPLAYLVQALIDLRDREPRRRINRLVPHPPPALPERFVFFPLQVRQDSQLTVHSPVYGPRLDEAIADLVAALAEVAPDTGLVVKLHPADRHKTDYDPVIRRFPQVLWLDGGDVRRILPAAAAVVTVNSTVGLEALVFDRPVIVLGNAAYGFDGLVHRVAGRAEVGATLARALSRAPNAETTFKYLLFLYFKAFAHAHPGDYSTGSKQQFCARLLETLKLADTTD